MTTTTRVTPTSCDGPPIDSALMNTIADSIKVRRQSAAAFRLACALATGDQDRGDELLLDADVATVLEADEILERWTHS